jgi:asparagine synthase (glutamine-hydrolysing)
MIAAMGLPLSTPNEVAINEVARALRGRGHIVALSGEGADELFAGYDAPMMDAAVFEGVPTGRPHALAAAAAGVQDPGHFQLLVGAWVPPASKGAILDPEVHRGLEGDGVLLDFYRDEFARFAAECEGGQGPERLQPHLRFLRRINLAGLLQRLDTATMLASVEGRTPFADVAIAALAESLPVSEKITLGPGAPETKRVLRRAFAAELPELVLTRAKASFPLPMPAWVADVAPRLRESPFARALFNTAAIETVAANASQLWQLAWPMVNLSLWGDLFWG